MEKIKSTWAVMMAAKPDPARTIGVQVRGPKGAETIITEIGETTWFTASQIEDMGGMLPRNAKNGAFRVTLIGEAV